MALGGGLGQTVDFAIGDTQTTAHLAEPTGPGRSPGVVVTFRKEGWDWFTRWLVDDPAIRSYAAMAALHYHALPPVRASSGVGNSW